MADNNTPDSGHVESLDELANQARTIDMPAAAPAVQAAQAAAAQAAHATMEQDWVDTFKMLRGMGMVALQRVRGIPPETVKEIWSDAALEQIAAPAAEICRRHGLSIGDMMDRWGPYIGLTMALGVPGFATYELLHAPAAPKADGQQQPS
ncbi:MAG: hypothetical protein J0H69_00600 [Burkholderiales bacterium]|nr:hypothetical protein [Burkholderiales bacterium]